jgi:RNA polymerase sigma-70 factor (ECF subfamily)
VRKTRVNGRPGFVGYFGDGSPQSVVTLDVLQGRIRTIRLLVNPDKLEYVPPLEQGEEDAR